MYHTTSIPSREQQWSDEVRYLHSLWHQGTPQQNPNPNKPNPSSSIPTIKKKIVKKKKKKTKTTKIQTPPPQVEWPCNNSPIVEDTRPWTEIGWPEPAPKPPNNPVSAEEQKKFAAVHIQQKSVKACQDFFSGNNNDSSNSESEEEEYSSEDEDEDEDEDEEEEFFLELFKEDNELRDYYEKNSESGEFCCLVCGVTGQKIGKRYKNCVALVQHSVAISKTKRRSAHRAFGKAVCRVLGWDIKRLPSIVLSLDDPLGCHLVKPETNENTHNQVDVSVESDDCEVGLNSNEDHDHNKVNDKEPVDTSKNADAIEVYNVDDDDVDIDELYKDLDNDNMAPF